MQANYQGAPVYTGTSSWSSIGNSVGTGGQYACQAVVSGTVTATLTWVPATGKTLATDPPSEPVPLLQTSYAAYSGGVGSGGTNTGGNASDGLGDPCLNNKSQGKHLIQRDGSSGTITLDPVSLSASTAPYTPPPYGPNYAQAGAQYTVAVDSRAVTISSSIDPTYYKVPVSNARAQNSRVASGALNGDTLIPAPGSTAAITYIANVSGSWGSNSQGQWSNVFNPFGAGFTFGTVPIFPQNYGSVGSGFVDPVSIQLADSSDGAVVSNSYTMRFHNEVEDWFHDTSKDIIHPTPTIPTNDNYDSGDHSWQRYGPTTGGYDFKEANGSKQSDEVKVGVEGEVGIDSPITLAFKANEDVTQGQEYSSDTEHEYKADLPDDGTYIVYYGLGWEEHFGTMDIYNVQGFRGVFPWSDTKWQLDPSGHIAIRIIPVKYSSK